MRIAVQVLDLRPLQLRSDIVKGRHRNESVERVEWMRQVERPRSTQINTGKRTGAEFRNVDSSAIAPPRMRWPRSQNDNCHKHVRNGIWGRHAETRSVPPIPGNRKVTVRKIDRRQR